MLTCDRSSQKKIVDLWWKKLICDIIYVLFTWVIALWKFLLCYICKQCLCICCLGWFWLFTYNYHQISFDINTTCPLIFYMWTWFWLFTYNYQQIYGYKYRVSVNILHVNEDDKIAYFFLISKSWISLIVFYISWIFW